MYRGEVRPFSGWGGQLCGACPGLGELEGSTGIVPQSCCHGSLGKGPRQLPRLCWGGWGSCLSWAGLWLPLSVSRCGLMEATCPQRRPDAGCHGLEGGDVRAVLTAGLASRGSQGPPFLEGAHHHLWGQGHLQEVGGSRKMEVAPRFLKRPHPCPLTPPQPHDCGTFLGPLEGGFSGDCDASRAMHPGPLTWAGPHAYML